MKIRDEIIECIRLQETNEDSGSLAITLFLFGITALFSLSAAELLSSDAPSIEIGNSKSRGKSIPFNKVKCLDIMPVLLGGDFGNHYRLYQHSAEFIQWFFDLEVPKDLYDDDGNPILWYDISFIQNKWNEFTLYK